jgi:hypothetical protein
MRQYTPIQYDPSHVSLEHSTGASRYRHWHGRDVLDCWHCTSIFLRPFAPPALPGFDATMGALTPGRRFFVSLSGTMNAVLFPPRSPFLTCSTFRPFRPQPPSCHFPIAALTRYLSWMDRRVYPPGRHYFSRRDRRRALGGSPLASRLPDRLGRIRFVILRTGRSPPVALHPASRRRSYFRLQVRNVNPDGDFHPTNQTHSEAH